MIQTCAEPPRSEMNAICLESGDHSGRSLSVPCMVICCGDPPPLDRDSVDLLRLGVLRQIDGLNGEGDGFAVGRELRLVDARDLEQGLYIEGLLLGRRRLAARTTKEAAETRKRHMTRL